jgi:hypothetical protein
LKKWALVGKLEVILTLGIILVLGALLGRMDVFGVFLQVGEPVMNSVIRMATGNVQSKSVIMFGHSLVVGANLCHTLGGNNFWQATGSYTILERRLDRF